MFMLSMKCTLVMAAACTRRGDIANLLHSIDVSKVSVQFPENVG